MPTFDLAPAALIKAGSGLLFLILGAFIFARARRSARVVLLGAFTGGFGGVYVSINLVKGYEPTAIIPLVFALAGVAVPFLFPRMTGKTSPALLLVVPVIAAVAYTEFDGGARPTVESSIRTLVAATFAVWTARAWTEPHQARRHVMLSLAAGFGLFMAYSSAESAASMALDSAVVNQAPEAFAMGFVSLGWLAVGARWNDRGAICLSLVLLVAMLVGVVFGTILNDVDVGMIGLMRIAGWGFLVWGILKLDLLGVPLPRFAVRGGTIAAMILATFFVVAQIAQNFFTAQLGLISGGLVAGAMLFMASPIQRAAERMLGGGTAGASTPPAAQRATERDALAYRHALRAALADGAMTPKEEEHLAELAETLGLGATTTLRLRREEEAGR